MARAPFQILVFPYRRRGDKFEFALFRRADDGYWQGIAGGGGIRRHRSRRPSERLRKKAACRRRPPL